MTGGKEMELELIFRAGERMLSPERWAHCQAVARLGRELAERHGADPAKAEQAGLLHDLTKELSEGEQLQMLEASGIVCPPLEDGHALTGFLYARDRLGVRDPEVLDAIRYHTAGRSGMCLLEKVVFAADKFAYDRAYPRVEEYRFLAFADLDGSMLAFFENQIPRRIHQRRPLLLDSIRCYNWLLSR